MENSLLKKWSKALKSGKYRQCRDVLSNHGRYCCLGVLGKVCGYKLLSPIRSEDNVLTTGFRNDVGMSSKLESKFVNMNDEERLDFKQIAEYIDKELIK